MAKKVATILKLQIPAGAANPSPPVGPALGQAAVNIMDFCNAFNAETQSMEKGLPLPVVITYMRINLLPSRSSQHQHQFSLRRLRE